MSCPPLLDNENEVYGDELKSIVVATVVSGKQRKLQHCGEAL